MSLRKIGETAAAVTDVCFWDDDWLLAVGADVAVWRLDVRGERRARVAPRPGGGDRRLSPRLACHAGASAIVVNTELYHLFGRIGDEPWRQVLDSAMPFFPDRLVFAPDGARLLVTGTDMLVVVDPTGATRHVDLEVVPGRGPALFGAWTASGRLLVYDRDPHTGTGDLHLDDGSAPRRLAGPDEWGDPVDLAVGPGGESCVVAFSLGRLAWYSLPALELLGAATSGAGRIDFGGLTATPDGRTVAVEAEGGVRLWDIAARTPLTAADAGLRDPRISPSGRRVVARPAGIDNAWSIWELSGGA